jgi:hypothetical protein
MQEGIDFGCSFPVLCLYGEYDLMACFRSPALERLEHRCHHGETFILVMNAS